MQVLIKTKQTHQIYNLQDFEKKIKWRLNVIFLIFFVVGFVVIWRLFILQIKERNYYSAMASDQHEIFQKLNPERGKIYVANDLFVSNIDNNPNLYPLATNLNKYLLFVVPKEIENKELVLQKLSDLFNLRRQALSVEEKTILSSEKTAEEEDSWALYQEWSEKLTKKDDPYEPLKHLVDENQIDEIKKWGIKALRWSKEKARFYPEKNIGSTLLGFVGKQAESGVLKGYYGLESCYDKVLAGESGFVRSELDNTGRWIALAGQDFREAEDGQNIVLTIDRAIQFIACDELNKAVKEHQAEKGSLIIMEPSTGKILAMCTSPDFDPNEYNKIKDLSLFNNTNITESYESGSVYKTITMAMGLNMGLVTPFSGYNDTGEFKSSGFTIKNSDLKANGWQTMTQVLEKSLNTGAIYVAQKVGKENFKKYSQDFGFGQKTDIDLCGESIGNMSSLEKKGEIYLATGSFGQGITATPIQLVRAYSAIVNEGKLMKPYLIDSIIDKTGKILQKKEPQMERQVISAESARLLSSMLVSVVTNGHTKRAAIAGYQVGGKTGTAQIHDAQNGGYGNETMHTFIGFAPLEKPRFVMLVKMDKPKDVQYAEGSVAPVFSTVGKFILDYYNVPKDAKN